MFHIFNSIFLVQFYSPGASIIMSLHYYHIMLDFCEMNGVFEGIFQGFAFRKVFFGFSVSGKVFFESFRNTQLRSSVCKSVKSTQGGGEVLRISVYGVCVLRVKFKLKNMDSLKILHPKILGCCISPTQKYG